MTVLDILIKYQQAFADGLMVTFQMCLIIWSVGLIFGSLLGVLAAKWTKFLGITDKVNLLYSFRDADAGIFILAALSIAIFCWE